MPTMPRLFALLTLFCATTAAAEPAVTGTTIGQAGISIRFGEPMVTWAHRDDVPATITPPLDCDWVWQSDTTLQCATMKQTAPLPATRYTVHFTEPLWLQTGERFAPPDTAADYARPELAATGVYWADDRPVFELQPNAPVDPAAVHEVLRARLDDGSLAPYELDVMRSHHGDRYGALRLTLSPIAGRDRTVSVELEAGLRSSAGELRGIAAARPLIVGRVNESFRLRGLVCGSSGQPAPPEIPLLCDARADIGLIFSQPPSPASLDAMKALLPARSELHDDGAYERGDNRAVSPPGHRITLRLDAPNTTTSIALPASIASKTGEALSPATIAIRTGDYPAAFTIAPLRALAAPGTLPPLRVTAANLVVDSLAHVEIDGRGARRIESSRAVDAQRREVVLQPPAFSPSLRHGGLVYGEAVAGTSGGSAESGRYVAAFAPFNVTVGSAEGQAVVWATRWQGAAPIAGAGVEVFCLDAHQDATALASGRTDAAGVALLALARSAKCSETTFFVRVRDGGDTVVMPSEWLLASGSPEDSPEDYDFPTEPTREGAPASWGVTDRPLYRAGETVRYRVWLRERHRNRYRPADSSEPRELELKQGGETLKTWQAGLDAFGAVAGEVQLPATAEDGDYCIRFAADDWYRAGACFDVTAFRANDVQVAASADRIVVRHDESFVAEANVGYYSGGTAAGSKVTWDATVGWLSSFAVAYPDWAGYTFNDEMDGMPGRPVIAPLREIATTDAQGRARSPLQLQMQDANPPPAFAIVELFAQAAGGRTRASSAPVTLHWAQYARYVGLQLPRSGLLADPPMIDAVVVGADGSATGEASVEVEFRDMGDRDEAPPRARCVVAAGKPAPCVSGLKPGRYRLTARSGDAAPAYATIALSDPAPPSAASAPVASLSLVESPHGARVDLAQPFRRAVVLFTVEHGEVLDYWTTMVDTPTTRIDIPRDPRWAPGYVLRATAQDADARLPLGARPATVATTILVPVAAEAVRPVGLVLDRQQAAPGDTIVATLHNDGDRAMQVTLAVVDEAVRALAGSQAEQTDPAGIAWLGRLRAWTTPGWDSLGDWPSRTGNRPWLQFAGDGERLKSVFVSGSGIRRVDLETSSPASLPIAVDASRRVRRQFADTAWWQPDVVLQPGEKREVRFALPDNLTRWRVLAWSNDADDAFALAQATVEAQSPLELRLDVPARVHAGDRAVLGVSVGNRTGEARTITAMLAANGAGIARTASRGQAIAAHAQSTLDLAVSTATVGRIDVAAQAQAGDARDAVAASVDVATTQAREHTTQTGWIGTTPLRLAVPPLPAGASASSLRLTFAHGPWSLAESWIVALRDYPHTCWEQTLSRAVGAAVAIRLGLAPRLWPDAEAAIRHAYDVAPSFQENGRYRYFPDAHGGWGANAALTTYTVRAFALLRDFGHAPPEPLEREATRALSQWLDERMRAGTTDETAAMLGALAVTKPAPEATLRKAWRSRSELGWYGYAELARALAANDAMREQSAALLGEILAAARASGPRLVLPERGISLGMGSALRDRCSAIDALQTLGVHDEARTQALLAGLVDLYAGGAPYADTQASAQCLVALAHAAGPPGSATTVTVVADGREFPVTTKGAEPATWQWPDATPPARIELRADVAGNLPVGYTLDLGYDREQRRSGASAVGFGLQRRYDVLRDGAWHALSAAGVRAGDWVRVTLTLTNTDLRRFVAVTDTVPGGLSPADPGFDGVGTAALRALAGAGDGWFGARRIDERNARFYAEYLAPGRHEIHYYARAQFQGTYFAPPALAELMYGSASTARTAPATFVIRPEASR